MHGENSSSVLLNKTQYFLFVGTKSNGGTNDLVLISFQRFILRQASQVYSAEHGVCAIHKAQPIIPTEGRIRPCLP